MFFYLALIGSAEGRSAFEEIYHTYRGLMFYIANRILNQEQDAEDAVHSAFIKIAENIEKISTPVCPKTRAWVVIIVERQAINMYNRKKHFGMLPLEEENVNLPSPSLLDGMEEASAVAKAIARLPAQFREVILLKFDQGFDDREIGKMLDMKPDAVAKRIQRGKALLKNLLEKEGVEV